MNIDSQTLDLSLALLARPSVTPDDQGCQRLIADRLEPLGFACKFLTFGDKDGEGINAPVQNLWAKKGDRSPLLCFVGHTDVVPAGDASAWRYPPFEPTIDDGYLYGRGAADMKTAIAAFVVASERFIKKHPDHKGSIALLITADEEGPALNGTAKVVEYLKAKGERIEYCLVGEPSSEKRLGDTLKNGRRGSLGGVLRVQGKQGHVAYPHLAINPIGAFSGALSELCATVWDTGNDYFPATTLQFSNIHAGQGASNVVPDTLSAVFNFRFSTETCAEELKAKTRAILDKHILPTGASYTVEWRLSGEPFLTKEGALVEALWQSVYEITGERPTLSTAGGTSDGRFVAPMGASVAELGVLNATIHQIDERVAVEDLGLLTQIYERALEKLLL